MLLSTTLQISWLPLKNTDEYNQSVTSLIPGTGNQNVLTKEDICHSSLLRHVADVLISLTNIHFKLCC